MEQKIKGYILLITINVLVSATFSVLQDDGSGDPESGEGPSLFLFSVSDQYSNSSLMTETPDSEAIFSTLSLKASTIILTETLVGHTISTSSVAVTTAPVPEFSYTVFVTSQQTTISSTMSTASPITLPTSTVPLTTFSTSLFTSIPTISPTQTLTLTSMTQPSSMAVNLITSVNRLNQFSSTLSASGSHSITLSNTDDMPSVPLPVLIAVPAGVLVLISTVFMVMVLCCVHCRRRKKYTVKTAEDGRLSGHSGQGQRSATPAMQDLKELKVDNSKDFQSFGASQKTTAATFGIEFPETPKYGSNEEIPALIILNPVKPNVEPLSNAQWSQTLPSRQKIRKQTCSESDAPDRPDTGVLKPAKSMDAIDTMTRVSDIVNNVTSTTLLLPEIKRKSDVQMKIVDEDEYDHLEYDHLSPEDLPDGIDACLGSTAHVFLEPAEKSLLEKTEYSAPDSIGPEIDKDAIYLQPSSVPVPSQPPQAMVPTDPTSTSVDTESIYDIPKSSEIDSLVASMLASYKQSTNSGIEASFSTSKESPVEVPSHYDVPKNALSAFKEEAPKQLGFSAQPNSGTQEASQNLILNSLQENRYNSLGTQSTAQPNSPPYYDVPKHLLLTKNGNKFDNTCKQDDDFEQETNMDDVELESSGEHIYCVPPDVVMNIIKNQKQKPVQTKASQHETVMKSPQQQEPMQMKASNPDPPKTDAILVNKPQQLGPRKASDPDLAKIDTSSVVQVKASKPDPHRTDTSSTNKPQQQEPLPVKASQPRTDTSSTNKPQQQEPSQVKASQPKTDTSSTNKQQQQEPLQMKASTLRTDTSSANKPQQQEPLQVKASKPKTDTSSTNKPQQQEPLQVKASKPKTDTSSSNKQQQQEPFQMKASTLRTDTGTSNKPQQQESLQVNASKPRTDANLVNKPQKQEPVQVKALNPVPCRIDTSSVNTPQQQDPMQVKASKHDLARTITGLTSTFQLHESVQNKAPKPDSERTEPSSANKTQQHKPLQVKMSKPEPASAASKSRQQKPVEAKPSKPESNRAGVVDTRLSSPSKSEQQKPLETNTPKSDSDRANTANSSSTSTPKQHKLVQEKASQPDDDEVGGFASLVSKPVPMKRKKNDVTQRNSLVPAPRPAKRPTNLTKNTSGSVTSSLEDLIQEQEPKKTTTVSASKPVVPKRPKVLPKSSVSSGASSSEDLLQEPSIRNDAKVLALKPAVARKPKKLPKSKSDSVASSQEELLGELEVKDVFDTKNVTVNGEKSDSESICESPSQEGPLKFKPKVLPRSQSRQAIVSANMLQELVTKQTFRQTNAITPNETTFSQAVVPNQPLIVQKSLLKVSADS